MTTVDGVLEALVRSGEIQLSNLGDHLQLDLVPEATPASVHEALTGISVPIEEMIREEREKYEA